MFSLMPQSTATTLYLWFEVREYQRFLQLTRRTRSRGSSVSVRRRTASSRGVEASVMSAFWLPSARISRVSLRVSTPATPGRAYSPIRSERGSG